MSRIIVRPFDYNQDAGIIYASWAKGVFFGSYVPIKTNKTRWLALFSKDLELKIKALNVTIACMEDAEATVLGYLMMDKDILEWIYVKPDYRKEGIAKLLIKKKIIKGFKYVTRMGKAILDAHPELKGEEDGTSGRTEHKEAQA